jgi:DHA3 family macrolide efflux protein-like MFS transporter
MSAYAANFREDFLFGFRWIRRRPRMFRLLAYVCIFNFGATIFVTMQTPLALALFDASRMATIVACGGVGLFAGGLAVSLTGGIQPLTRAIYLGSACIATAIGVYGTSGSMLQSAVGAFAFTFFHPFVNTAMQVLWRTHAPLDKQGAIFSVRRMFTSALGPAAIALSVPIADHIAAPALAQVCRILGWSAQPGSSGKLGLTLVLVSAAMLLVIGSFQQLGFLKGDDE